MRRLSFGLVAVILGEPAVERLFWGSRACGKQRAVGPGSGSSPADPKQRPSLRQRSRPPPAAPVGR